jgi:hypothetical protein
MTPRQKRILAALAILDVTVILAMVVLAARLFSTPLPLAPTDLPETLSPELCQWKATQLLAQAELGGIVTLSPGESLRFEIVYPLAPGQVADQAAQQVWTTFDVALALEKEPCSLFSQVEVAIRAIRPNAHVQDNVHINASVSAVDLRAFGAGELGEDEFIEHVFYEAISIHAK